MAIQQGQKYIFVSYAHKDTKVVLPLIQGLMARNFNIWYDNSIEAGSEWPEYIATNLLASECVIVFMSPNADASHNCRKELTYAIDKRKKMIVVYLEDFQPTPGTEMQLHNLHALYLFHYSSNDAFLDHLTTEHKLQSCICNNEYPFSSTPTLGSTNSDLSNAIHYGSYSNQSTLLLPMEEVSSSSLSNKPADSPSSVPVKIIRRSSLFERISNHLFCPITCLLHLSYIYIGSQFLLLFYNHDFNIYSVFIGVSLILISRSLITFFVTCIYHLFRRIVPANTRAKSFKHNKFCFHVSTLGAIIYSCNLFFCSNIGVGFNPSFLVICCLIHIAASVLPTFFIHVIASS